MDRGLTMVCQCRTDACPDARVRAVAAEKLRRMLGTGVLDIPSVIALLEQDTAS